MLRTDLCLKQQMNPRINRAVVQYHTGAASSAFIPTFISPTGGYNHFKVKIQF